MRNDPLALLDPAPEPVSTSTSTSALPDHVDAQSTDGVAEESSLNPLPRSSASVTVLATLAVIVCLWWGQSFAIPLVAGTMLAVLIAPLVMVIERVIRMRLIATILALIVVVMTLTAATWAFGGQLLRVTERMPEMISLAADRLTDADPGSNTLLSRVRKSLSELDSAANRLTQAQRVAQRPTRAAAASNPASAPATFSDGAAVAFKETAVSGSSVLFKFAGDLAILLLIAFFLLSSTSSMAERLVEQWSYHPSAQHRAEKAVRQCAHQIRVYVGVLVVTNSIIGVVVWAVFGWAGLPDAAGWGVTAAVLHVIPYLGMGILMGFGAGEAFLAHGTLGAALATALFLLTLSTIVGTMVTAWLQGRAAKMNAAAVFIGLVFWGALWGIWGLFLGPALVVVMKTIAEHSRSGQRLARLMEG